MNIREDLTQSSNLEIKYRGYWFRIVTKFSAWWSIERFRDLSFFFTKRARVPSGDVEQQINPLARFY